MDHTDITNAGPIAQMLLQELQGLNPNVACAALALALGYVCERGGVDILFAETIVREAFKATPDLGA